MTITFSYISIRRRQGSMLREWPWLGTLAGRARNKDKSADSGSYKHSWSHCSENRSLITHGQPPRTSQENWISAGWKLCFTRMHRKKAVCFNLFKTTTGLCDQEMKTVISLPCYFFKQATHLLFQLILRFRSHTLKECVVHTSVFNPGLASKEKN